MSSANLELVRSICTARERGDYGSADWAHPEIEYVMADGPTPGTWVGLDELAEGMRDFLSAWEDFRAEVDGYRELDDERVLVLLRFSGRGKTSGLELAQTAPKGANLFLLRGVKVTRIVHYFDREHALADLGLAPEAESPGS
jgi:SnoaL-like protein